MVMRAFWVFLHRYVGLAMAAFVTVAGLTGSLLAYWGPLNAWLVPERTARVTQGPVLSLAEITARVQAFEPRARVTQWRLDMRAGRAAEFDVSAAVDGAAGTSTPLPYERLFLDPVSGEVFDPNSAEALEPVAARVLNFIYTLHYTLALPGEAGRRWGIWIMGVAALLWFVDCFVGAWLTLPRGRPLLARWKPAWGVRKRRLNFDLHRAGGLWLWGMLAILALSSVQQNLNHEVLMPVARRVLPLAPDPFAGRAGRDLRSAAAQQPPAVGADAAAALALAEARRRGWQDRAERMQHDDAGGMYRVIFTTPASEWFTSTRRELYFDDHSGQLLHASEPGHGKLGDTLLDWLSALHFGTVLGWPYKLLLCVTGLAVAALSVTGVVIWWRKLKARLVHAARNALPRGAVSVPRRH